MFLIEVIDSLLCRGLFYNSTIVCALKYNLRGKILLILGPFLELISTFLRD